MIYTRAFSTAPFEIPTEIESETFKLEDIPADTTGYHLEGYTDEIHLVNTALEAKEAAADYEEDHDSVVASWQA